MPGYDKNQFISLPEEDELSCAICFGIFKNPVFTRCCRQTYCSDCVLEWLKAHNSCPNDRKGLTVSHLLEPPRVLINLLNKLQMKCTYSGNGCNEVMIMENLAKHLTICEFNPESLCNECGYKVCNYFEHSCIDNLWTRIEAIEELRRVETSTRNLKHQKELYEKDLQINRLLIEMKHFETENRILKQSNTELFNENLIYKNKNYEQELNQWTRFTSEASLQTNLRFRSGKALLVTENSRPKQTVIQKTSYSLTANQMTSNLDNNVMNVSGNAYTIGHS